MKAAVYCRVSTDKADQANSFEAQQRYFKEYIERSDNITLYDVYADEGITGTATEKRGEFNRMLNDARSKKFQLIITKEVSRFSRNILDAIKYTRELKNLGVNVLFINDHIDLRRPDAEMQLAIMATMAQEESRKTSERVKWGQQRQMERGVVFGHSLLGYDVRNGEIVINSNGAKIVRAIFYKYAVEKKSLSQIGRELKNEGYLTLNGNLEWNASSISKILKNEKYVGDLVQKKTFTPDYLSHKKRANHGEQPLVIIENHHEPIIEREIWDMTQQRLKKNRKALAKGSSIRYAFSGKIECGECGANFAARYKTQKNGGYLRWRCQTAAKLGAKQGCAVGRMVTDKAAADMFFKVISSLDIDFCELIDCVLKLAKQAKSDNTQSKAQRLETEAEKLKRKKLLAADMYLTGDITLAELRQIRKDCDEKLAVILRRLENEKVNDGINLPPKEVIIDILSGSRMSQAFIRLVLEKMTVFKDKTVLIKLKNLSQVWHFKAEP